MLNLRLTLLEPWLRDGARAGEVVSSDSAHTAMILSKGRTRLLLPLPGESTQRVADTSSSQTSYLVPGVAESAKAYEFTPVGLRPTAVSRLAGGAQVVAHDADSLLLLTDDVKAAAEVQRRVMAMSRRAEALQQGMAVAELRHAEAHLSPLVLASGSRSPDAAVLAGAALDQPFQIGPLHGRPRGVLPARGRRPPPAGGLEHAAPGHRQPNWATGEQPPDRPAFHAGRSSAAARFNRAHDPQRQPPAGGRL